MHKIFEAKLLPALFADTGLHATAACTRVQLQYAPADTLGGHYRRMNRPKETLRRAIRKLVEHEWVYELERQGRRSPLIVPWMPPDVEQAITGELEPVRREVNFIGEWLMKCILDLVVDDRDFRDNARPHWFTAGDGRGRLEIDRWYRRAKVAIEFHGTHHYRPEAKFHENEQRFIEQRLRDHIKAGLCLRHGLQYVEIAATELGVEAIINKIRDSLPLRPFPIQSPLIRALDNMCHSYVNSARRGLRKQANPP